jgi:hypothetical protein
MSSIGSLISRHRNNAALSPIVIGLGLLFAACGVLLLAVRGKADPDGLALINGTLAGCLIIGALLIALGFYLRRGAWLLGDEGVQAPAAQHSRVWRYRDIAETCQFYRSGVSAGLAWRSTGSQEWATVSGQLGGYRKFRDTFMDSYLRARVPVALNKLERGHVMEFRFANQVGQLQKNFVLGIHNYVNVSTDSLILSGHKLKLPDREIALDSIVDMDVSAWTSRIGFVLRDGSKTGLSYTALFDAPLLLALLERLIKEPAPSYG